MAGRNKSSWRPRGRRIGSDLASGIALAFLAALPAEAAPTDFAAPVESAATVEETAQNADGDAGAAAAKPGGANPNAAKPDTVPAAPAPAAAPAPPARFDIDEYRVEGADALPQIEVEEAVYPFLGPNRSAEDVEKARSALEKAYHDKGYQTVGVSVPPQNTSRGFVVLKVTENRVGRLRVKGSRYYDLAEVKRKAKSVQEGKLPNFNEVTKDIVSLNQWPDRRVTPALRAGAAPGTVDVDLNVEDKHPLHGSIEINNRQSPDTTALRLNAQVRYDNLWQLGHSISFTYQVAPERPSDARVYSGSYLARTETDWLNLLFYGLKSESSVATVGGVNVVGPGQVFGGRAVMTLPGRGELFHTLSVGLDYKDFEQTISLGSDGFSSPVSYVPLVASYGATWQGDGRVTQANLTATMNLRGIGSDTAQYDAKRYNARGNFFILHGDISHAHDLPGGFQAYVKAQGQIADQPLVSSEQISIGGLDTVRGYLESEALGDYGGTVTAELRSPNLAPFFEQTLENVEGQPVKLNVINDWRFFAFADAGRVMITNPLPEQDDLFDLASYGVGTRFKLLEYLNGLVLVGVPLTSQQVTVAHDPRLSFRFWGEF